MIQEEGKKVLSQIDSNDFSLARFLEKAYLKLEDFQ